MHIHRTWYMYVWPWHSKTQNMHLSIYSEPIMVMASIQPEHTHTYAHTPRRPFKYNTIATCHKTWDNVCRHAEIYNGHTSPAHWHISVTHTTLPESDWIKVQWDHEIHHLKYFTQHWEFPYAEIPASRSVHWWIQKGWWMNLYGDDQEWVETNAKN